MLGLVVESETVDSNFTHLLDVGSRVGHVHVTVEVHVRKVLPHGLDDGGTDGQVGHEVAEW